MSNQFWNMVAALIAMALVLWGGYDVHRRYRGRF